MESALQRLNALPAPDAEAELRPCCGSARWARELAARRPFRDRDELCSAADDIWRRLESSDWLEAFASHPKIGEKKPAAKTESAKPQSALVSTKWSAQEQSGVANTPPNVMERLAEGNREYERSFGYIFIVCATGKTAEEMLALLEQRLQNDPSAELRVAAEEQRRIMQLRLEKLLAMQNAGITQTL